jgi:hypothetical protein
MSESETKKEKKRGIGCWYIFAGGAVLFIVYQFGYSAGVRATLESVQTNPLAAELYSGPAVGSESVTVPVPSAEPRQSNPVARRNPQSDSQLTVRPTPPRNTQRPAVSPLDLPGDVVELPAIRPAVRGEPSSLPGNSIYDSRSPNFSFGEKGGRVGEFVKPSEMGLMPLSPLVPLSESSLMPVTPRTSYRPTPAPLIPAASVPAAAAAQPASRFQLPIRITSSLECDCGKDH